MRTILLAPRGDGRCRSTRAAWFSSTAISWPPTRFSCRDLPTVRREPPSGAPGSALGHQRAVWLDRLATVRRSAVDQQTPSARRPAAWTCWTRQQLRRNSQVLSRNLPCLRRNPTQVKPHYRRSRHGFDSRQLHQNNNSITAVQKGFRRKSEPLLLRLRPSRHGTGTCPAWRNHTISCYVNHVRPVKSTTRPSSASTPRTTYDTLWSTSTFPTT